MMIDPIKGNATGQGGVGSAGGQANAIKQRAVRKSTQDVINKTVAEIQSAGLRLRSTASDTQLETLPKVLQFRGPKGLNTYEGVALGYLRIATRIKELKETWDILSIREDVIGPDGLWHKGVARYVLQGKRKPIQADLDLGLEGRQ